MEDIQKTKINKRALYYALLNNGIGSVVELDHYLTDICFLLETPRSAFVQASAKGLFACTASRAIGVDYLQISNQFITKDQICTFLSSGLQTIIVVEKDTVFQRLIEFYQNDDTVMLVTGKGYPDYATRKFLTLISEIGD